MNKKQYKEFEKRYDKFKNNNLPTSFWDDERQTLEYVYFDDDNLTVNISIFEALCDFGRTALYYPFTSGYLTMGKDDVDFSYAVGHNHAHSFEEVVHWLYDFPESFSISKEEEEFYSEQELRYLNSIKGYLLFIGLKDCQSTRRSKSRFKNKKHEQYKRSGMRTCDDETIRKLLNGEEIIHVYQIDLPEIYEDTKIYDKKERTDLIRNEKGKIIGLIEYTRYDKKLYKDVKKEYPNKEFKDDDYVIIHRFKLIKKF